MKAPGQIGIFLAAILCLFVLDEAGAAGRKNGGGGRGGQGGQGQGQGQQQGQGQNPSTTQQEPTFKDVAVNASFYFSTDPGKTYRWIKISATTASNTVNGAVSDPPTASKVLK